MKNKFILALSFFVTMSILTVGIGLITRASANNNPPISTLPSPTPNGSTQREQAYLQIIGNANQRIEEANQQIAAMANQILVQPSDEPVVAATSTYLFSAEQAAALAQQFSGNPPKFNPELVSFSGTPAYEVIFGNGKIYIDANSGSILFNGLQKQVTNISSEKALSIAAKYLNTSHPISISISSYNGVKVYVVLFEDGQSVYISLTGKIIAVQKAVSAQSAISAPPTIPIVAPQPTEAPQPTQAPQPTEMPHPTDSPEEHDD
jgi:hypothetical protein